MMNEAHQCIYAVIVMILTIAAFLTSRTAEARTYYVATSGDDNYSGEEAQPLRTIQKAADLARAGDAILVHGGIYSEAVVLRFSGQEGKPITLKNAPGDRPVIQPRQRGEKPPGHGILLHF